MKSLRDKQKNHIRAAREWLGEAESSLECENDVRSDLKLMLARAELEHVKDTPSTCRLKERALKILPAVCAVAIVAVGLYCWPSEGQRGAAVSGAVESVTAPARAVVAPPTPTDGPAVASTDSAPLPEVAPGIAGSASALAADSGTNDSAPEASDAAEPSALTAPATAETAPAQAVAAPAAIPEPPAPPTAEMQQLMQSAGKILRQ